MNFKRIVSVVVAALVGIGIVWVLYARFRQAPPSPLPIAITQFATPHSGLLHIAEAKGYFAAEGLRVTVKTVETGHQAITQVLQREADVGSTAETPLAKALAEGKQPKIIANIFSSRWSSGIIVRKDHGILQPTDLKGKRIGFIFGTNVHYDLETFLAFHNIPLDAVTMVPGTADQLVTAITAGELDAASTWEPWISQIRQKLGGNTETYFPQGIYSETVALVVRPDYVRLNRTAVDRLLRALLRAELFAETHPDEAIGIIEVASGMNTGTLRLHSEALAFELSLAQALLLATENEVGWFFRRGLVPAGAAPDVLQAFEIEPLRAIKPISVTISK